MTTSARISYVIMAVLLILIGWLHLATLVLTAGLSVAHSTCSESGVVATL